MSDDRSHRQPADHRDGDLSRERSPLLPVHILRVDVDIRVAERIRDRRQSDRGGRNSYGHTARVALGDVACELDRVGDRRRIHLPVADHDPFAHQLRTSGRSISRCSTSIPPGQNSRVARATSSAMTTDRWRPPVQPNATPSRAFFSLS